MSIAELEELQFQLEKFRSFKSDRRELTLGLWESYGYLPKDFSPKCRDNTRLLYAEKKGTKFPLEKLVITVPNSEHSDPSGHVALLILSKIFAQRDLKRTLWWISCFQHSSALCLKHFLSETQHVQAIFILDSISHFTDFPNSQQFPWPLRFLYPHTGNFLTFIGNFHSRALVNSTTNLFGQRCDLKAECIKATRLSRLSHPLLELETPAVWITDTNEHRLQPSRCSTTLENKSCLENIARIIQGLTWVIEAHANYEEPRRIYYR